MVMHKAILTGTVLLLAACTEKIAPVKQEAANENDTTVTQITDANWEELQRFIGTDIVVIGVAEELAGKGQGVLEACLVRESPQGERIYLKGWHWPNGCRGKRIRIYGRLYWSGARSEETETLQQQRTPPPEGDFSIMPVRKWEFVK